MELLLPFLLDEPTYNFSVRPSRILNQHFGVGLEAEDFLQPLQLNNREVTRTPAGYLRRWHSRDSTKDTGSTIAFNKDNFEASLDVQQFKPEELSVRVTGDNVLTIEGKHDEKNDEHGSISRHFVRRYILPKNYDVSKIESKLSSDGVLTISAPAVEAKGVEHKSIPVTQTGEPAKQQQAVDQKKETQIKSQK